MFFDIFERKTKTKEYHDYRGGIYTYSEKKWMKERKKNQPFESQWTENERTPCLSIAKA